jgi:hypothetical protein
VAEIVLTILRRRNASKALSILGAMGALALPLGALASPAGAVVERASGTAGCQVSSETCFGVQPRNAASWVNGNAAEGETFGNAAGHPVLHSPGTYAIYWDPEDLYRPEWQGLIDGFLFNLGSSGGELSDVFSNDQQYIDGTGRPASDTFIFHGAYTDTAPYPSHGCTDPSPPEGAVTCLTDAQVRSQLEAFIPQHGLQRGMGTVFYLLTPPGVTICLDAGGSGGHCSDHTGSIAEETETYKHSFCSYHSDVSPTNRIEGDSNTIIYAVVPWIAGGMGAYSGSPPDGEPAYDCQDGGFDPSSKPNAEEKEHAKEHTQAEEEVITKMTKEEKISQKEKEAREGPHEEEPNQLAGTGWAGDYAHGLADLITNQIAVEQQNAITDPLLDAWQDSGHHELTDECRNVFASRNFATGGLIGSVTALEHTNAGDLANQSLNGAEYYLNNGFNLAADRLPGAGVPCVGGVSLQPDFTAPDPVNAGEVVGFDGMESDITLDATGLTLANTTKYATYTWNYGDAGLGDATPVVSGYAPGSAPCEAPWLSTEPPASARPPGVWIGCAASVYHAYKYGGTYTATLAVTDVGGNTAAVTHEVTVNGPAAPPSVAATSTGSAPASAGPPAKVAAIPTATATILSRVLPRAASDGLIVRYSVSEQVAGYFQVLLSNVIDKRLGIGGAPATGLPKGSPSERVIAYALLVTTKGGHNTVKILFSKHTAERLNKLGRVSLTLRMVAHNATSAKPVSVTVMRTVTLVH